MSKKVKKNLAGMGLAGAVVVREIEVDFELAITNIADGMALAEVARIQICEQEASELLLAADRIQGKFDSDHQKALNAVGVAQRAFDSADRAKSDLFSRIETSTNKAFDKAQQSASWAMVKAHELIKSNNASDALKALRRDVQALVEAEVAGEIKECAKNWKDAMTTLKAVQAAYSVVVAQYPKDEIDSLKEKASVLYGEAKELRELIAGG